MGIIKLGLCQLAVSRDKGENLRRAESALRQAAIPDRLMMRNGIKMQP